MELITLEKERDGLELTLTAQSLGRDWNVTITGGEVPHLGAAALGAPYRHKDGSIGSSASVLVLPSHKEDGLVKRAAEVLAKRLDRAVLVSGGIHIDGIAPEQIAAFLDLARAAVDELGDAMEARAASAGEN